MVYITGDTHGELGRFFSATPHAWKAGDTVIICGDFGYIFTVGPKMECVLDSLENEGCTICFVDGNHENFPAIYAYPEESWNGGRVHKIREHVFHLMRGQVFNIEGKLFFTMGGAYSIDRCRRIKDFSYWDEELPNDAEYKEALANLARHNNTVDYILTHTCPTEIIRMMGYSPDLHDIELTGFLEYLLHEVTFTGWYFGHWHLDQKVTEKVTAVWFEEIAIEGT